MGVEMVAKVEIALDRQTQSAQGSLGFIGSSHRLDGEEFRFVSFDDVRSVAGWLRHFLSGGKMVFQSSFMQRIDQPHCGPSSRPLLSLAMAAASLLLNAIPKSLAALCKTAISWVVSLARRPGLANIAKAMPADRWIFASLLSQFVLTAARISAEPVPHLEMHFIMVGTETSTGYTRSDGMMRMEPAMGVGTEGMKTVERPQS
jgi:hypothetical protein